MHGDALAAGLGGVEAGAVDDFGVEEDGVAFAHLGKEEFALAFALLHRVVFGTAPDSVLGRVEAGVGLEPLGNVMINEPLFMGAGNHDKTSVLTVDVTESGPAANSVIRRGPGEVGIVLVERVDRGVLAD